jgi:hypothetical protein
MLRVDRHLHEDLGYQPADADFDGITADVAMIEHPTSIQKCLGRCQWCRHTTSYLLKYMLLSPYTCRKNPASPRGAGSSFRSLIVDRPPVLFITGSARPLTHRYTEVLQRTTLAHFHRVLKVVMRVSVALIHIQVESNLRQVRNDLEYTSLVLCP